MRRQRGLSLLGLIIGGGIVVFLAIVGMKVTPAYIEYFTIQKHLRELARSPDAASIKEIQNAFDKRADIDDITALKGADLNISKSGNQVYISASYEKKVPLFGNVSALFDFEVSSTH
jgi:hypothetical protein